MKKIMICAVAAVAVASAPGFAQKGGRSNAGAEVTRAQAETGVRGLFARADVNRDGFVSTTEAEAARSALLGRGQARGLGGGAVAALAGVQFNEVDSNRDGRISLSEARLAGSSAFARADANRDGRVSREELKRAR